MIIDHWPCITCIHFKKEKFGDDGHCRRHSPSDDPEHRWPKVKCTDWCSDFDLNHGVWKTMAEADSWIKENYPAFIERERSSDISVCVNP